MNTPSKFKNGLEFAGILYICLTSLKYHALVQIKKNMVFAQHTLYKFVNTPFKTFITMN